jgi:hypothetical protein
VTPARGATGFFPQSHLVMLEGLKYHLNAMDKIHNHANNHNNNNHNNHHNNTIGIFWNWNIFLPYLTFFTSSTSGTSSLHSAKIQPLSSTITSTTIPWSVHNSAIKEWGHIHTTTNQNIHGRKGIAAYCNKVINWFYYTTGLLTLRNLRIIDTNDLKIPLKQLTLKDNQVLLVNGFMAHTTMFASELMDNGEVRSLQNAKIRVKGKSQTSSAIQTFNSLFTTTTNAAATTTTTKNTSNKNNNKELQYQLLLLEFIKNLPKNAPLRKLVKSPINYASEVERYHRENFNHYNSLSDEIYVSIFKLLFISHEMGNGDVGGISSINNMKNIEKNSIIPNHDTNNSSNIDNNDTTSTRDNQTLMDSNSIDFDFTAQKLKYKAVENSTYIYRKLLKKYTSDPYTATSPETSRK